MYHIRDVGSIPAVRFSSAILQRMADAFPDLVIERM